MADKVMHQALEKILREKTPSDEQKLEALSMFPEHVVQVLEEWHKQALKAWVQTHLGNSGDIYHEQFLALEQSIKEALGNDQESVMPQEFCIWAQLVADDADNELSAELSQRMLHQAHFLVDFDQKHKSLLKETQSIREKNEANREKNEAIREEIQSALEDGQSLQEQLDSALQKLASFQRGNLANVNESRPGQILIHQLHGVFSKIMADTPVERDTSSAASAHVRYSLCAYLSTH
ncbi:uncharacterized protein F5Z01DRAFT_674614 [Emericellopsis atlantica]|uniref:Uncharacterized protein n=1 Tax=Emericellopsis atlantica TaxID=2614577 RepID=A0A9P7ZLK7_9HYPO|nr:uncharacterized protein F5Z01DRAFT_674614 [Emericellopsis atlantica]KAG9253728.1 hypothetical protein F5Z01DRAFT_674614 [Emericellopsis atlantica]